MSDKVITIPQFAKQDGHASGFTQGQFKRLDGLYLKAAAEKTLTYRSVECDFDDGFATYTYYQSANHQPYLQFIIRQVGPRTTMFELYLQGKGRIAKSGLFERVFEKLQEEIQKL